MNFDSEKQLTVFSSEGRLSQCDNALKAASNGSTSVGACSKDGCVLVSFKDTPPLVIKEEYSKIYSVCDTIGCTYSGLQPDFRIQLEIGVRICEDYYDVYGRYPDLDVFVSNFSGEVQEYTIKKGFRPFGTLLIFTGEVNGIPFLYQVDPSGSYQIKEVTAIGKDYNEVEKYVSRRKEMLDDNISNCLESIREYAGREIKVEDVDIGVMKKGGFKVFNKEEVQEIFDSISRH
ncbi:Proteasome subunit alpha type-2 [Nosema bombycis CQ1]|uniref:Proteasome subunit alpha type-2 n=1 Tax=Nosema bombycis (strain CQ1 / CVCC 102059) TaxID=578461 RepID=R0M3D3_NOSB1|nr:Proteasome subunit alpha type-2 [Nosema bombycis CQ1]|eukprot:EOB12524.1 Proteasome subunit alpha type-2 [Nosema bombycis CQ1]